MASRSTRSRPAKWSGEESTFVPNWLELPRDITTMILKKLGSIEIVMSASLVCSLWWNICNNPLMWRTIDMTDFPPEYGLHKLWKICCVAVERSCGHLEDISIRWFGDDSLLIYIVDRSSNLRRLRFLTCSMIYEKGVWEVAKKLPLLEELEVSYDVLTEHVLEAIGQGCPLLKTLKLQMSWFYRQDIYPYNPELMEFAIAKTMPGLHYLQIWGMKLNYKGLLAILDGCPLLECLDLQRCLQIDFSGGLDKSLFQQTKKIRLPISYSR